MPAYMDFIVPKKYDAAIKHTNRCKAVCEDLGSAFGNLARGNRSKMEEWADEKGAIGLKYKGYHGIELKPLGKESQLRIVIAVKKNMGDNRLNWDKSDYGKNILTWLTSKKVRAYLPMGHYFSRLDGEVSGMSFKAYLRGNFTGDIDGPFAGILHGDFDGKINGVPKSVTNQRILKSNKPKTVVGELEGSFNGYAECKLTGKFKRARKYEWYRLTQYRRTKEFKDAFEQTYELP